MPEADLLLHTGDLTNNGSMAELQDVNDWFGRIKHRFAYIVVIAGNHDVHGNKGKIDIKAVLTNAIVLHHELCQPVLDLYGLRIYGSPWCHWKPAHNSGGDGHLFDQVPDGLDILMTHGPPLDILDVAGYKTQRDGQIEVWQWGSSKCLNDAIIRAQPRVHLFGHLHEQRGVYQRDHTGNYVGGVEYPAESGKPFPTRGPPPRDWPCDLISCNAMCNHSGHEGRAAGHTIQAHIAGPARLIQAVRSGESEAWQFSSF